MLGQYEAPRPKWAVEVTPKEEKPPEERKKVPVEKVAEKAKEILLPSPPTKEEVEKFKELFEKHGWLQVTMLTTRYILPSVLGMGALSLAGYTLYRILKGTLLPTPAPLGERIKRAIPWGIVSAVAAYVGKETEDLRAKIGFYAASVGAGFIGALQFTASPEPKPAPRPIMLVPSPPRLSSVWKVLKDALVLIGIPAAGIAALTWFVLSRAKKEEEPVVKVVY